jgi:hypothetical protein
MAEEERPSDPRANMFTELLGDDMTYIPDTNQEEIK